MKLQTTPTILFYLLTLLLPLPALAATYYVDPTGSDSNNGSSGSPFQTIQRAADVAAAGDIVNIRPGTYRETVTPANSGTLGNPITFRKDPASSGDVIISGADIISGWTLDGSHSSGQVYRAPMNWDLDDDGVRITSNQVFVDGVMMNLARWPNNGFDVSRPNWAVAADGHTDPVGGDPYAQGNSTGHLDTDQLLELPAGDYSGAWVHLNTGESWSSYHGTVTSIAGNRMDFSADIYGAGPYYGAHADSWFYIADHPLLLDTYGEWHLDTTTDLLHLWSPTGEDPSSLLVEAKRRHLAFNLYQKHYIDISGIDLFACTIVTSPGWESATKAWISATIIDGRTWEPTVGTEIAGNLFDFSNEASNINLDQIRASYVSHFTHIPASGDIYGDYWSNYTMGSGIVINGTNNTITNSVISYSAGNGVAASGTNNRVENCIIHDIDYMAIDCAGVNLGTTNTYSTGIIVKNNDIFNSGRSLVLVRSLRNGEVSHNHMWNSTMQTTDGGGVNCYSVLSEGTEIAYNIIQDCVAPKFGAAAIYLDEFSTGHIVHHNVTFNVHMGIRHNMPRFQHIYNNTLIGLLSSNGGIIEKYASSTASPRRFYNWGEDSNFPGSSLHNYIRNNIFTNEFELRQAAASGNLPSNTPNPEWAVFDGSYTYPLPYPNGYPTTTPEGEAYYQFTDAGAADFSLQAGSPAIDVGTSGTDNGVPIPAYLYGNNGAPDAGAFEHGRTNWSAGSSLPQTYPNAPSHLTATSVNHESVTLSWNDNSSDETAFYLERSLDARVFESLAVLPANTTGYTDEVALGGYYYRVRADNSPYSKALYLSGTRSALSQFEFEGYDSASTNVDKVSTGIALPDGHLLYENVRFYSDINEVQIHIEAGYGDIPGGQPGDGEWYDQPGYDGRIEFRLGSPTGTLLASIRPNGPYGWTGTSVQSFSLSGFPDTTADLYVVMTTGGIGNASWFTFNRPNQSLSKPLNLAENSGNLSWTDTNTNEAGYLIERSADNITWLQIAKVGTDTTAYAATEGFFYRVRAYNLTDFSEYSNVAGAGAASAPETSPNAPSSLTATSASATSVDLSWLDNSLVEDGYRIEQATSAGGPFTQVGTTTANGTGATVGSLSTGQTYYFRVYAHNAQGNSAYSNLASITVEDPNSVPPAAVYEGFDGGLNGTTSQGWTGSWWVNTAPLHDNTGLTFGELAQSPGGALIDFGWKWVARDLTAPLDTASAPVWISFLHRYDDFDEVSDQGSINAQQVLSINNGDGSGQLNIGIGWSNTAPAHTLLIQQGGAPYGHTLANAGVPTDVAEGETVLYLVKLTHNAVGNTTDVEAWIYTDPTQMPVSEPTGQGNAFSYGNALSIAEADTGNAALVVSKVDLVNGGYSAGMFDEIRIDTDFSRVLPRQGATQPGGSIRQGTAGDPLRIMAIGDSITQGVGGNYDGGYRPDLQALLQNAGYTIRYEGANDVYGMDYGTIPATPVRDANMLHNGYASQQIDDLYQMLYNNAWISWPTNPVPRDPGYDYPTGVYGNVAATNPEVVLIMLGTNNMWPGKDQTSINTDISSYQQLIDAIFVDVPSATIFVAQIPPRNDGSGGAVPAFNTSVASMVSGYQAASKEVYLVNNNEAAVTLSGDDVHPDDAGFTAIAQNWFDAITSVGSSSGGYSQWVTDNSLTGNTGEMQDADGDGIVNFLEYFFGMSPNGGGGQDQLPVLSMNGNKLRISFEMDHSKDVAEVRIVESSTLDFSSATVLRTITPSGSGTETITQDSNASPSAGPVFLRVEVECP